MAKPVDSWECTLGCWAIGALVGGLAFALLIMLGGWPFFGAAFVGAILFVVAGAGITWMLCGALPEPVRMSGTNTPAKAASAPAAEAPAPKATEAAPAPAAAAAEPVIHPSAVLPGQQELAARKGTWTYQAPDAAPAGSAPGALSAARDGKPDDLKQLKGVGPKLEQTLNGLGIYHFDQIAAWTADEVATVDEQLKFKGRIERDGWIEQARALASGPSA
jgi:predicted flap endonuclease-1-like 5' DNA nuclease